MSAKPSDRNHARKNNTYFESPTLKASQQRCWDPNLEVKSQILQRASVRVAVSLLHSLALNYPPLANNKVEHVRNIGGNRETSFLHS